MVFVLNIFRNTYKSIQKMHLKMQEVASDPPEMRNIIIVGES